MRGWRRAVSGNDRNRGSASSPRPVRRSVSSRHAAASPAGGTGRGAGSLRSRAAGAAPAANTGTPAPQTPEEATAFVRAEIAKWRDVAQNANVRLEG